MTMAKQKFQITYTAELDTGDLPAEALAEYLQATEETHNLAFTLWEVFGPSMTLQTVERVQ